MIGFRWIDKKSNAWVIGFGIGALHQWSSGAFSLFLNLPIACVWIENVFQKFQITIENMWAFELWRKQREKYMYEWILGKFPCPSLKKRILFRIPVLNRSNQHGRKYHS